MRDKDNDYEYNGRAIIRLVIWSIFLLAGFIGAATPLIISILGGN